MDTLHCCSNFLTDQINIAIGLLIMMYPILCKVQYETLHHAFRQKQLWIQVGFSIIVNWIIAPFLMVCPYSILFCTT